MKTKTSITEDLRALLNGPRDLWLIYLATLFEYLGVFSFLQTLPLWLSDDYGMSDETAGWWAAIFSLLVTLFVFFAGGLADTLGTVWSINSMAIIILAPCGTALTRNCKPFHVLSVGAAISSLSPFVLCFGSAMPYQIGMIAVLTIGEAR